MNREIKFRAWNGKKITYTPIVSDGTDGGETSTVMLNEAIECYDYILMQYTGLKDKNGKEIYEGDIGKVHNGDPFAPETLVVVIFENGSFGVYPLANQTDIFANKYMGKMLSFSDGYNKESFEVIGNRYENPELL